MPEKQGPPRILFPDRVISNPDVDPHVLDSLDGCPKKEPDVLSLQLLAIFEYADVEGNSRKRRRSLLK